MRRSIMHTIASAALVAALAASVPAAAQMAVIDAKALIEAKNTITQLKSQLDQLKQTYSQLQQSYQAATGTRNMGDILNNPAIRNQLPSDWRQVYDGVNRGGYAGISGSVDTILGSERYNGSVSDGMAAMRQRQARLSATSKATGIAAFEGAQARLNQLDALRAQINGTQDPKAIAELQARIAAEQGAIQNEHTKLQLMAMLQDSEEKLAAQQRRDLSARILNKNNTRMPVIQ